MTALTPDALAAIRARHDAVDPDVRRAISHGMIYPWINQEAHADRGALLAEVQRLRAALADVGEILASDITEYDDVRNAEQIIRAALAGEEGEVRREYD